MPLQPFACLRFQPSRWLETLHPSQKCQPLHVARQRFVHNFCAISPLFLTAKAARRRDATENLVDVAAFSSACSHSHQQMTMTQSFAVPAAEESICSNPISHSYSKKHLEISAMLAGSASRMAALNIRPSETGLQMVRLLTRKRMPN